MDRPAVSCIGAVVVHYKGVQASIDCVQSLPNEIRVVIVDNSGEAPVLRDALSGRPGVLVIGHGANIGFGAAANAGALEVDQPYILFVNPDCRPGEAHLGALLAALVSDDRLAAVGPALVDEQGRLHRDGGGWFPAPLRAIVHAFVPWHQGTAGVWLRPRVARRYDVDWLTGACLLARAGAFAAVGGFAREYPLYSEDMDLGRRWRLAGWRVLLDASVRVPHQGGGSDGDGPGQLVWMMRAGSLGHYLRANSSSAPAGRVTIVTLAAGYALRAVVYAVLGRQDRRAEMWTYARCVLSRQRPNLTGGPSSD